MAAGKREAIKGRELSSIGTEFFDALRYELKSEINNVLNERQAAARLFLHRYLTRTDFEKHSPTVFTGQVEAGWEKIESLSSLRAIVGGRFQQLKDRWVGAGLPLREKKGDRTQLSKIDGAGWNELALWINKQGFEIRRPDQSDTSSTVLEIRKSER
jgi:hypothetical protein